MQHWSSSDGLQHFGILAISAILGASPEVDIRVDGTDVSWEDRFPCANEDFAARADRAVVLGAHTVIIDAVRNHGVNAEQEGGFSKYELKVSSFSFNLLSSFFHSFFFDFVTAPSSRAYFAFSRTTNASNQ